MSIVVAKRKEDFEDYKACEVAKHINKKDKYVYKVYGIASHGGSLRGGHYVAYIRKGTKYTICILLGGITSAIATSKRLPPTKR